MDNNTGVSVESSTGVGEFNMATLAINKVANWIWEVGNSIGFVEEGEEFLPSNVVYASGLIIEGLYRRLK